MPAIVSALNVKSAAFVANAARMAERLAEVRKLEQQVVDESASKRDKFEKRGQLLPRIGQKDWMEWQAGYISGALLMPRSRVKLLVEAFGCEDAVSLPLQAGSIDGQILIGRVSELFDVSREAAEADDH